MPEGDAVATLASCYRSSLDLAREASAVTIAFPNISTGVYRFPKELAAETAVGEVRDWVGQIPDVLDRVIFVCFGPDNLELYRALLTS
jgi:O-acetyl-ADP-ribose deacetylase (regulator of RNase III)